MNDSNSGNTEIKVKTAYNGEIMITYINENISFDELCNEIRGICRFSPDQVSSFMPILMQFELTETKISIFKFNSILIQKIVQKR